MLEEREGRREKEERESGRQVGREGGREEEGEGGGRGKEGGNEAQKWNPSSKGHISISSITCNCYIHWKPNCLCGGHILNRYKIVPICFTWLLFINEVTRPRKPTWGHREAQSWESKLSSEDKNHKLDNLPGIPRLLGAGGEPWVLCVHYPLRPHPPASLLSSAVTSRGEATVHVHACKERGGGRGYNTSQLDHIHSLNFAAAGGRECTPPQLSCYRSRIGEGCVFTRCGQNTGLFTFCRCLPTLSNPMNN